MVLQGGASQLAQLVYSSGDYHNYGWVIARLFTRLSLGGITKLSLGGITLQAMAGVTMFTKTLDQLFGSHDQPRFLRLQL